jgi:nucleoside-diphosphate-sugar epimerase
MVIGDGLLAKAFRPNFADREDILIFASGVSNSSETDESKYQREINLLQENLSDNRTLVYFSSCSILDRSLQASRYVGHKIEMEKMVLSHPANVVFRLPQVIGFSPNPNTLTNYFFNKIMMEERLEIWKYACRNFIDIEDVVKIACRLLTRPDTFGKVINVASNKSTTMLEVKHAFERVLARKIQCALTEKGCWYNIDTSDMLPVAEELGIAFDENYLDRLIGKYYGGR